MMRKCNKTFLFTNFLYTGKFVDLTYQACRKYGLIQTGHDCTTTDDSVVGVKSMSNRMGVAGRHKVVTIHGGLPACIKCPCI